VKEKSEGRVVSKSCSFLVRLIVLGLGLESGRETALRGKNKEQENGKDYENENEAEGNRLPDASLAA
jgi:hypothetical protein